MEFNFLTDRIEIKHKTGKLWDADPDLHFNDTLCSITLTFIDKTYTKYFQDKSEYFRIKNHCEFYF